MGARSLLLMLALALPLRCRALRPTRALVRATVQRQCQSAPDHLDPSLADQPGPGGTLYGLPITVHVDADIVRHLRLPNHQRKARLLLPRLVADASERALRRLVEGKIPALASQPYVLRYAHSALPPARVDAGLLRALEGRLSIALHVHPSPGEFPPPEQPYLEGMADPLEARAYTMLSFYRFARVEDPSELAASLRSLWRPLRALGRVYVAAEGVNAQMAVPSNVLEPFRLACCSLPLLADVQLNVDHEVDAEAFAAAPPFEALHVRVRDQIVADGWAAPLDWTKAGREVGAREWDRALSDPAALVLDCRNGYESQVGAFEGATALNTTFFRESWDALDEALADSPLDRPLLTYCTGGIRCVKVNAYLEQRGFSNVSRLRGGVVAYVRELREEGRQEESRFRGVNYVFDERMGSRVTADVLGGCDSCGAPSDRHTNCAHTRCHIRLIQCAACSDEYAGCCCRACQESASSGNGSGNGNGNGNGNGRMAVRRRRSEQAGGAVSSGGSGDALAEALSEYCARRSSPEPPLLRALRLETDAQYPSGAARMLCGPLQGRLLAQLCALAGARHALELGTFTGYSSLCLAEGVGEGGKVLTCDSDPRALAVAARYHAQSPHGARLERRLCKAGALLEECYAEGRRFDLLFIDADKRAYLDYLTRALNLDGREAGEPLLRAGGLVVVDNTLWKGLVLAGDPSLSALAPEVGEEVTARMRSVAASLHAFNEFAARHPSLQTVMLPMRDGLSLIRFVPDAAREDGAA